MPAIVTWACRLAATAIAALVLACGTPPPADSPAPRLVIFAAASLRDVAGDLAAEFTRDEPIEVVFNFAGSNTLAQQILAAPGADLFLSADREWVEEVEHVGRAVPGTRRELLRNGLVLVARPDASFRISAPGALAGAGYRFLAIADPRGVPAGRYARATLERLAAPGGDLWSAVAGRVAPALDARAALALVESDPEIVGIVYRTDALSSSRVRVLYDFPDSEEVVIAYWAVLVADGGGTGAGRRFLEFLATPPARAIAERHGFRTVPG